MGDHSQPEESWDSFRNAPDDYDWSAARPLDENILERASSSRIGIDWMLEEAVPGLESRQLKYPAPWTPYRILDSALVAHSRDSASEIPEHVVTSLPALSTYYTAVTGAHSVFYSAISGHDQASVVRKKPNQETEHEILLRTKGVTPIDSKLVQDWSGLGQHVEFKNHEIGLINDLLSLEETLGKGNSAVVHSVKCRRILLARKTIYTDRRFTKRQAVEEVAHLTRLKHSHIVRLIGTYSWKTELSILMYPVADHNLTGFLDTLFEGSIDQPPWKNMAISCLRFFSCLSSALEYIHANLTKHMDIKPQNILVRSGWHYQSEEFGYYSTKVYISDFGIARSYHSLEAVDTDGFTSFTRKYAAPEVVRQDRRGLPADVFSLGCVFLEILATLQSIGIEDISSSHDKGICRYHHAKAGEDLQYSMRRQLESLLGTYPGPSYQSHLIPLRELFRHQEESLESFMGNEVNTSLSMIEADPKMRPTAQALVQQFPPRECCHKGPDELEATTKIPEGYIYRGAW